MFKHWLFAILTYSVAYGADVTSECVRLKLERPISKPEHSATLYPEKLDAYLAEFPEELAFMKPIIKKHVTHVSYQTFLQNLRRGIDRFVASVNHFEPIKFDWVGGGGSGEWIARHAYQYLKAKHSSFFRGRDVYFTEHEPWKRSFFKKKELVIENKHVVLLDDAAYQGRVLLDSTDYAINYKKPLSLNVIIPYMTTASMRAQRYHTKKYGQPINYFHEVLMPTMNNVLKESGLNPAQIATAKKYFMLEGVLFYFDHRIADSDSTVSLLRKGTSRETKFYEATSPKSLTSVFRLSENLKFLIAVLKIRNSTQRAKFCGSPLSTFSLGHNSDL